jgi:hypothetical protein
MSPIALAMNMVLALLLLAALGFGIRLDRRLKALRDGQLNFAGAVADLDRAAQRAENGLAELRAATDEAIELLAGRIEKARELASRLDTHTANAARPVERPAERPAQRPPERPLLRPVAERDSAVRPAPRRLADLPMDEAEAAAEDLLLRLTDAEPGQPPQPAPALRAVRIEPRASARSRASVDDDLFDLSPRTALGARR